MQTPNGPVNIHDYSTPYQTPDGNPVDTSAWSAADIAKALAAGYLVAGLAGAFAPKPDMSGYQNQWFPIPTYNSSGLVNSGVNPGFIEPSNPYTAGIPGVDQYYWGQHQYAQNMGDLANLNRTAPAQAYGNPNAINLGRLVTPEQLGYPSPQTQAAAFGPGQYNPAPLLAQDRYTGLSTLNTPAPAIPGYNTVYNAPTQAQMATGTGQAQQLGRSLNYAWTPQSLATVNNTGQTPAGQLTSISPQDLSAQLVAAANAAGGH